MSGGTLAIILFAVGILVSIMIHEWGHFATARRFGMRADRFFVGFGPTLWSTRRGETEYGVKAFPVGGFVRIKGMSPTDERLGPVYDDVFDRDLVAAERRKEAGRRQVDVLEIPAVTDHTWQRVVEALEERGTPSTRARELSEAAASRAGEHASIAEARTALRAVLEESVEDTGRVSDLRHRLLHGDEGRFFHDRPAWQRAIVLAAGSTLHFAQAVVLLFFLLWLAGPVVALPVVGAIQEGSPADDVGLQPDDRIVAVEGVPVADFEEARQLIRARPEEPTRFTVQRGEQTLTLDATPTAVETEDGETIGLLGFSPQVENQPLPLPEALGRSVVGEDGLWGISKQTFVVMGRVFGPEGIGGIFSQVSGEEERDETGAISMIGAGRLASEGAESFGLLLTLGTLLASINVFIGIFNLLPLPPLDGGHLAVLGVEQGVNGVRRLSGRPADFTVDPRAVAAIAVPVIVIFATVSFALLWLDIVNPVSFR